MSGRSRRACAPRRSEAVQVGEALAMGGYENVPDIFARQIAGDDEAVGKNRWQVLRGMDGEVDVVLEEGGVELLGEEPLAARFRQWTVLNEIARGSNHDHFDPVLRHVVRLGEQAADQMGLRQREGRPAGADLEEGV